VRLLIDAHAHLDSQDARGVDALMLVAQSADVDLVRRLLEAGARTDVEDKLGRTALWYAAHAGMLESARLLVQQGAGIDNADAAVLRARRRVSYGKRSDGSFFCCRRAPAATRIPRVAILRSFWPPLPGIRRSSSNCSRLIVIKDGAERVWRYGSHDRLPQGGCGTRADAASGRCEHPRAAITIKSTAADIAEARSFNKLAELLRGA